MYVNYEIQESKIQNPKKCLVFNLFFYKYTKSFHFDLHNLAKFKRTEKYWKANDKFNYIAALYVIHLSPSEYTPRQVGPFCVKESTT